ncbi:MAG: helix-turn-helix transcriptional regulator [Patulibacter sp.]|nr:helix-turn-helix transcriptional regulator [Patulibacter sp.]
MEDRLRELLDLVIASLDAPGTDGRTLAERASFSRDHLDRIVAAATGESPVAMRRRLLLERAAWQLRTEQVTAAEAATAADFGSPEAFSRAFSRAFGVSPGRFRDDGDDARAPRIAAPNGVHFHPPAGLLVPRVTGSSDIPGAKVSPGAHDLTDRLVTHHLDRSRALLDAAGTLPADALARPLRPGFVAVWFEGEEPSAALMAERLVRTLEVWTAAIVGEPAPDGPVIERAAAVDVEDLRRRFARVAPRFSRVARSIRDRGAWDDAFVDALCEPPQSFTYGGVLAHVVSYGAVRREMLASVLAELGAMPPTGPDAPDDADPILWEQRRRWGRAPGPNAG